MIGIDVNDGSLWPLRHNAWQRSHSYPWIAQPMFGHRANLCPDGRVFRELAFLLAKENLMAAYMITEILSVTDTELMNEYRQKAGSVVARFRGRFVARAEPCLKLEGEWARVAIVEFPDLQTAQQFYDSEDYSALKTMRHRAANARIIVIAGI